MNKYLPKKKSNLFLLFLFCFALSWQCFRALCCKGPPPPRPEYDLVCIGLSGSGKTSLLSQLCSESPENIVSTTGRMLPLFHGVLEYCPKMTPEIHSKGCRELQPTHLAVENTWWINLELPLPSFSICWYAGEYAWKHTIWNMLKVWTVWSNDQNHNIQ